MESRNLGPMTRRHRPAGRCLLFALLLGLGAAGFGCESKPAGTGDADAEHEAPAAPPVHTPGLGGRGLNVLLVSVDTTRADHIACYGHPEVRTPNIDRLAAEGIRFAWCISSAPLTLPSHTTMLTGSYPFVHGARDNGIFTVPEQNQTLAELFKAAGYATRAEVAAVVLKKEAGLNQGFDTYNDVVPEKPDMNIKRFLPDPWDLESDDSAPPVIEHERPKVETDRKAGEISDCGIAHLKELAAGDKPFFLFLHYFDPHWPHEAPEPFASAYKDSYLSEIAYFDSQFGRVLDAVDELGLADNTLVILTSDHGEGRGQHGEYTHSTYLYDTTLHVPLIMRVPGGPAGEVVESQVRLLDIASTIVDFARLEPTGQMQGQSLLPLVADPGRDLRLPCYSDTMVPKNSLDYSPLRSLRADGWKYILAPRSELYHVGEDTDEVFNIIQVESERADQMRRELRELIADSPPPPGGRARYGAMSDDDARKLAALGYVSVSAVKDPDFNLGSELDHFEPTGINPRDRIEVVECWASGLGAFRAGQYELAEATFRRFNELEPLNQSGVSYLGRSLMMLGRYDEAIQWLRRAVELNPESFLDYRALGNMLVMRNDLAGAEEAYRKAIEYNPGDETVARLNLGMVLGTKRHYQLALKIYDEALEIAPDEPALYLHRGITLRQMGRLEEAMASLAKAAELAPELAQAQSQLAMTRQQLGLHDEAIAQLQAAIDRMPEEPLLAYQMAQLYVAAEDFANEGVWLARVAELRPDSATAWRMLGANHLMQEKYPAAVEYCRKALDMKPDDPAALFPLAVSLEALGEFDQALAAYGKLVEVAPKSAVGYRRGANLMAQAGDEAGAIAFLQRGLAELPDYVGIANDLAWHLATAPDPDLRDGEEAVRLAQRASTLMGDESYNELDTLAAAYAEIGRFDDAVLTAERALAVASQTNDPDLITQISARLELFRQGRPYRQR
jgi:choline-sulfatase